MVCVRASVRHVFCGRNSSETAERILMKLGRIVYHYMKMIILKRRFDSTIFTEVMALYRLSAISASVTFFVGATPLKPLNGF